MREDVGEYYIYKTYTITASTCMSVRVHTHTQTHTQLQIKLLVGNKVPHLLDLTVYS